MKNKKLLFSLLATTMAASSFVTNASAYTYIVSLGMGGSGTSPYSVTGGCEYGSIKPVSGYGAQLYGVFVDYNLNSISPSAPLDSTVRRDLNYINPYSSAAVYVSNGQYTRTLTIQYNANGAAM